MGILDGIVEWIAEQVMNILDLITTSVLGALGCSMDTFLRYFPAAETMYQVFLALGIGLILLNWVWQLFKNYFMGAGIEAEDPIKLSIRSFLFIFLTFYAKDIVDLLLKISGTPYNWILTEDLPPLKFADFNSVVTVILGVCANGAVAIIALILVLILAWNYIKLLFDNCIQFSFQPLIRELRKCLASSWGKCAASNNKFQVTDRNRNILQNVLECFCSTDDHWFILSLFVRLRNQYCSRRLNLRHLRIQVFYQFWNSVRLRDGSTVISIKSHFTLKLLSSNINIYYTLFIPQSQSKHNTSHIIFL